MRVPIQVFTAVCIFPIILGSPLANKNQNEDIPYLKSTHLRNPSIIFKPSKNAMESSELLQQRPIDWGKNNKLRNRTPNKSEAIGLADSTGEKSSAQQASEDGFENGELSSSLQQENETKGRSFSKVKISEDGENPLSEEQKSSSLEEDRFNDAPEKSNLEEKSEESDYDDSEDEEYENDYADDSEYDYSDEYSNIGDSELSSIVEAQQPGQNKLSVHHKSNQNQEFPEYYSELNLPQKYPSQDYQGKYNSHYRGYPTNIGYQGYYPSSSNQGHYPEGQLSYSNNQKRIMGHQDPRYGNQGPYPYRGYQGPHQEHIAPYPYRGYQGPRPYPGYPSPNPEGQLYYSNNQKHTMGHQDPRYGNHGPYPYRGYQGPHQEHIDPYRSYQGHRSYRGYPSPHHHGGFHTDQRHHEKPVNINDLEPNSIYFSTNFGRGGNEPDPVVGSGQDGTFSDVENDHSSSGDETPEYYDDDDDDDDSEYDDDESEVSSDRPEIPSQSDMTFESKELSIDEIPEKDVIKKRTGALLDSESLNDKSFNPKSGIPNESNRANEANNSERESKEVIHKCLKSIKDEENLLKNKTNTTILNDCVTETIENAEGNKSGRLLDIFTRTNISVECTTPKNESGQCKSFTECPIRNIMDNSNLFLQYMCLRGVFVGVCCPDNPVIEISDTDDDNTTKIPLDIQQPPEGCGLTQKTRIVGGTISAPHEWTWMVALMRRNRFFCGGVIINNWYVLTAAHCVLGVNVKDLKVRLGEYNFMERTDNQHDINVAEIKKHALFVTATFQHDIALLKLKRRIEYSKFIGSICLPETNARSYSDDKATVVGWGTVSFGGAASPILRQVTVPVWDNEDCDRTYFLERIDDSFLCAGSTENGEDACQGDSGGPLMTLNSDNRWEVIGIVSWGRRCGDPTYPGVYTRVTSYLDWISAHAK